MTGSKKDRAALIFLLAVSAVVLLIGLGQRELWNAETRWANIALQMIQSGDYLDPYLKGQPYYDKPLPSYWLITATARLMGGLGPWSLRLSSVLAAWLSIWLVYLIGERLYAKGTGLLAGWFMATTFFFVFWARVATADMLTVCGVLAAVWWYWRDPEDRRLRNYLVFFVLLAITSLFKGLIGFILPGLLLLPHIASDGRWKRHLNPSLVVALAVALGIYAIPFVLSYLYGAPTYGESGLALVFRENVVRFFQPFDNMGPIYTYLVYLPVYTLPWAPCWVVALFWVGRRWRVTEPNVRWLAMGLGLLFAFFTASGSRRSYYVLPLVPFAQLLGAWWVVQYRQGRGLVGWDMSRGWKRGVAAAAVLLMLVIGVIYPWTNSGGGVIRFASDVREQATRIAPWNQWRMVMIEVDNKLPMYLNNGGEAFYYVQDGEDFPRQGDSAALFAWLDKNSDEQWDPRRTLIVAHYTHGAPMPLAYLGADHQVITTRPDNGEKLFHSREGGSVAYVPLAVHE